MNKYSLIILIFFNIHINLSAKRNLSENISEKRYEGFFNFSYNEKLGKLIIEVDKLEFEFLYVNSLKTGIGSNDIGMDRGQKGGQRIVKFVKAGNKLLLLQPNYKYRANSNNPDEIKAVDEAFAQSVLWGFTIEKEENGTFFIDATDFFLRDAHNVTGRLKRTDQGNYSLDKSMSAIYIEETKNFPQNSEFESILTFTGTPKNRFIKSVTPTSSNITVRQHHSFIQLPDDNYKPRIFDPRSGYSKMTYIDYATPISEPIEKKFIYCHRLEKKDPTATLSEPVEPIIYYLDRGTPEPIRSALLEGASWWDQAFESIGYKKAFRVELLPEGVDLLDVRYNVIQWVHRSSRGWSYGSTISDPRTGEIIKGHVTIGSLRIRQDYLIAQGLLAPYENGDESPAEVEKMALARIKQLSAHEVGHTLGLSHNYISSTEGRSSVMDYPHPFAEIIDGKIVLTNAYDNKIGEWDKVTIAYGYQDFPDGTDEQEALNDIIQNSINQGLTYLSDIDARPEGSAHPKTHLWDNGTNTIDELNRLMEIRALALQNFGEKNIRSGVPYATLEEVLVPIYFFHRYQIEAVAKSIGGLDYRYALRGDGQLITAMIPPEEQIRALDALIDILNPEALVVPEHILKIIPPRPDEYRSSNELFYIRTEPVFDALGAAEAIAHQSIRLILHPARAGRLVEYHARDKKQPGLETVLDKLIKSTWKTFHNSGYKGEIQRTVDNVLLNNMMLLALSDKASTRVKAITYFKLDELRKWLENKIKSEVNKNQKSHYIYAENQIKLFQENPEKLIIEKSLKMPAGAPIGMDDYYGLE